MFASASARKLSNVVELLADAAAPPDSGVPAFRRNESASGVGAFTTSAGTSEKPKGSVSFNNALYCSRNGSVKNLTFARAVSRNASAVYLSTWSCCEAPRIS